VCVYECVAIFVVILLHVLCACTNVIRGVFFIIDITLFFVFCVWLLKKGVAQTFLFLGVWVIFFSLLQDFVNRH
jgi:hypothetical protein